MTSKLCLSSALAICGLLIGCSQTSESARRAAPDFALKDIDGREVKLSHYKGKVVLLNFWATSCGPCKLEIPWLMEFERQYKDRGFAVLGVSMDGLYTDEGDWDLVKPYVTNKQMNYRVALGNEAVAGLYGGVDALPTTFMVDKNGRIAATHVGLRSKDDLENEIKALLN